MRRLFSVGGQLRLVLEFVKRQWQFLLLPPLMFLLAAGVANQVFRARSGVETKEFETHFKAAQAAFRSGDKQRCLEELRAAEQVVPSDMRALASLGRLLAQLGQTGHAAEVIERSLRAERAKNVTEDNVRHGMESLAGLYITAGRPDDGHRLVRELLAEDPDSGPCHYWLGKLALRGEGDEGAHAAFTHFERSLKIGPQENDKYRDAQYESAICLSRLGHFKEAEQVLRELLAAEPGNSRAEYELAKVLQRLDETDEARALLKSFQEKEALARRRKHLETQVSLKQATSANLLELARILRDANEGGGLREVASMYTQREPVDPRGHRLLAKAYELLKQPEAAVAEAKLAAALPDVAEEAGADPETPTDADEVAQGDNP